MLKFLKRTKFNPNAKSKNPRVHLLHIGKTGGTAVKSVLKENLETPKHSLILHGHHISLKDIPKGEPVIFFLRDPISRFISGFYSRQRKGQPRYYSEWNPKEKQTFENFSTPNEVAVALADKNSPKHKLAIKAMKSVQHFTQYKQWYISFEYFQSRKEDILFVGFQESLNDDFETLKEILELPEDSILPSGDKEAHKNPADVDKNIEDRGVQALKEWYAEDYKFYSLCKETLYHSSNNG